MIGGRTSGSHRIHAITALASRVRDITRQVQMTQQDVAEIVGASSRTVGRWISGEVAPRVDARQRLLELAFVADELHEILGLAPEDANLWIFSPNRLLDGDTPADRISSGDYRAVHALIQAIADGVFV